MKQISTVVFLLILKASFSQPVFTENELITVVKQFHPVAKRAAIGVSIAKSDVRSGRGTFDPVFQYNNASKTFDGTHYYDDHTAEFKIPTWYGIDLYAGTENIEGSRINPEETQGSLSYLGVSVPVMQNLLMDKRRATLQQAKIMVDQSEAESASAVNDLLREALTAYWNWWEQHHLYKLADSSLQNAAQRFILVKKAVLLGDRPAIDTIEALTQIQSFDVQRTGAFTQLVKARLELNTFLWKENNKPYELPATCIPQEATASTALLLDTLLANVNVHPDLQQYQFKLSSLQIEKKLKFQSLLPDIKVKYQQLGKGYDLLKTVNAPYFENNYRFGVAVAVPLRLSTGRGEYQKAKLKIVQTILDQQNKQAQIHAKLKQYFTEWQQTLNQVTVQSGAVNNYALLQRGEEIRFANGESSLFMINTREQKTLEAKQKKIELLAKNKKALTAVQWAAGIFAR